MYYFAASSDINLMGFLYFLDCLFEAIASLGLHFYRRLHLFGSR